MHILSDTASAHSAASHPAPWCRFAGVIKPGLTLALLTGFVLPYIGHSAQVTILAVCAVWVGVFAAALARSIWRGAAGTAKARSGCGSIPGRKPDAFWRQYYDRSIQPSLSQGLVTG